MQSTPLQNRHAFFLISVASFLSVSAFAMFIPLLPVYSEQFSVGSAVLGFLVAFSPLVRIFVAPLWGILADRYGKKPLITLGLLGMAGGFLLFGLAPSIIFLFIARGIQGLFSGAVIPNARAYVADMTEPSQRVKMLGRLGAATALGIILGPALGGILGNITIALPFLVAAGFTLLNAFFVHTMLPETKPLSQPYRPLRAKAIFTRNFSALLLGIKSNVAPLFILTFIWAFMFSSNQIALSLLALEKFGLSSSSVGILFGALGLTLTIVQFQFLSPIVNLLGRYRSVSIGLILTSLGFLITPFLADYRMLFAAVIVAAIGTALSRPVLVALVSIETLEPQGVTMGSLNAFQSFGRLAGPLVGGALFHYGFIFPPLFAFGVTCAALGFVAVKNTSFFKPDIA